MSKARTSWTPSGSRVPGKTGIDARSIIVYRYYDTGSTLFGDGKASPIEDYAKGLSTSS